MRRPFLSTRAIYFIFFAGLFSLFSFFFDQQVIQKEGDVRNIDSKILELENEYSKLNSKENAFIGISQRLLLKLNDYHSNSTFDFKSIMLINMDKLDEVDWEGIQRDELGKTFSYQYVTRLYNLSYYSQSVKDQIVSYAWDLENKIEPNLFKNIQEIIDRESNDYQEYIDMVDNDQMITIEDANVMFYSYFEELKQLQDTLDLLVDLSNYFSDRADEVENILQADYQLLKEELVKKNYFILVSILMQILSLLFLLMLFRTIIKDILVYD